MDFNLIFKNCPGEEKWKWTSLTIPGFYSGCDGTGLEIQWMLNDHNKFNH